MLHSIHCVQGHHFISPLPEMEEKAQHFPGQHISWEDGDFQVRVDAMSDRGCVSEEDDEVDE